MKVAQLEGPHAEGDLVEEHAGDDEEFDRTDLEGMVDEPGPRSFVRQGACELGVTESGDPGPYGGSAGRGRR